jgi:DNA-binding MarR family transcriptional regulator
MNSGTRKNVVGKPRLGRISLAKELLQGFRTRLDESLHPLGITTAQLRVLWAVEANPDASGAEVARNCAMTPQSGQALLVKMEEHGWIRRRASVASERVLVAELTASGRKLLVKARAAAEHLDGELWKGFSERDLRLVDAVLQGVVGRLRER